MKQIIFGILITISIFIVGLYFFNSSSLNAIKLERNLADISIQSVEFDNKNYSILNGKIQPRDGNHEKVARLVSFYQWQKEDPLFDSPDFDAEEFMKAVLWVESEQVELLKGLGQTQPLYATAFPKSMAEASLVSKQFLENPPSLKKAEELIAKQYQAADAQEKEVSGLIDFISPLDEEYEPVSMFVQNSSRINLEDLKKIKNNASFLRKEIKKREDCLKGKGECMRVAFGIAEPSGEPDQVFNLPPPQVLTPAVIFNMPVSTERRVDEGLVRGPYGVSTACIGFNDDFSWPHQYFYLRSKSAEDTPVGLPLLHIDLATDVFFRTVSSHPDLIEDQQLYLRGQKYAKVGVTVPYHCNNLGYLSELAEIDLFLTTKEPILQREFSSPAKYGEFLEQAKRVEQLLFDAKYPTYPQLDFLANHYGYLYRLLVLEHNQPWVKEMEPLKQELLDRYSNIKRKLGNNYLIMNGIAFSLSSQQIRLKYTPIDDFNFIKNGMYVFRNSYGYLYFPFTPSVWRSSDNLEYIKKIIVRGTIGTESGRLSYTLAIKYYPLEEIRKWFVTSARGLRDLFERDEATRSGRD